MFFEGALTGYLAKKREKAFKHDELAILNLYDEKELPADGSPLFCTDSHQDNNRYHDCDVFDAGNDFTSYLAWNLQNEIDFLPHYLISSFVRSTVGGVTTPPKGLEKTLLSPGRMAKRAFSLHYGFVRAITEEGGFLRIRRKYPLSLGNLKKRK